MQNSVCNYNPGQKYCPDIGHATCRVLSIINLVYKSMVIKQNGSVLARLEEATSQQQNTDIFLSPGIV